MSHVRNQGVKIHYQIEGTGPPLVLLHGMFGSVESWYANGYVDRLRSDYQLILIDQRGHGQSDKPHEPDGYSYMTFVEDVITVLDETCKDRAHVFGHSMGGWFTYGLARYFPNRVQSLIISDGAPGRGDPEFLRGILDSFDEWVSGLTDTTASDKEQLLKNDQQALVAITDWVDKEVQAMINLIDSAIEHIDIPCLLLASDLSEDSDEYRLLNKSAELIAGATSITFNELNHFNLHRRSDLVLPHIVDFLASMK